MVQAFPLPFSKVHRVLYANIIETDPEKREELLFWQGLLDQISERKMSWDCFLKRLGSPLASHPAARIATTRTGETLLHLAVLTENIDLVKELGKESGLRIRRNSFGLTPLEVAQFLNRKACVQCLRSAAGVASSRKFPLSIDRLAEESVSKLEYLHHPIFESEAIFEQVLLKTKKAKQNDEIPAEKIWMGIYFDREVQEGMHPAVSIQYIDQEVGFGVFASKRIAPCAYVGEYTGVVQERKKKHLKDKYYCLRCPVGDGRKNYILNAEEKGNFTRYINHSATPNLVLQSIYWHGLPRMIFVALKEIKEGAQLTFDYGSFFWKECSQTPRLFE